MVAGADDSVSDSELSEIEKSGMSYMRIMFRNVYCQFNELSY